MSALRKLAWLGGAVAAAALAGKFALRQKRWFDFQDKSVLVVGGSRGLGLVIARKLVERGARVTIAARTDTDLTAAAIDLRQRGGLVATCVGDASKADDARRFVERATTEFGGVDVLFNCAGIIEVGPMDAMTDDDFHQSMNINCFGMLNTVRAALPGMRERGWGRVLNVCSLGGKRAVPHMLPYSTSKFAAVGLSLGLRAELAKDGIIVTAVCPSLMRTGSPRNATFKGRNESEYAWFKLGDALPFFSMNAEAAAEQIIRACQGGEPEVLITNPWNLAVWAQSLAPNFTSELLTVADRLLPSMGGIGTESAYGHDSESTLSRSFLTSLDQRAAERNNQLRPRTSD